MAWPERARRDHDELSIHFVSPRDPDFDLNFFSSHHRGARTRRLANASHQLGRRLGTPELQLPGKHLVCSGFVHGLANNLGAGDHEAGLAFDGLDAVRLIRVDTHEPIASVA
jgi:hypothetical protein